MWCHSGPFSGQRRSEVKWDCTLLCYTLSIISLCSAHFYKAKHKHERNVCNFDKANHQISFGLEKLKERLLINGRKDRHHIISWGFIGFLYFAGTYCTVVLMTRDALRPHFHPASTNKDNWVPLSSLHCHHAKIFIIVTKHNDQSISAECPEHDVPEPGEVLPLTVNVRSDNLSHYFRVKTRPGVKPKDWYFVLD